MKTKRSIEAATEIRRMEARARKHARDDLKGALPKWASFEIYCHDEVLRIYRNDVLVADDIVTRESSLPLVLLEILQTLNDAIAVAKVELQVDAKRGAGSAKGGRARAKPSRSQVDQLVRACLKRGEDPSDYAAAWARDYDYTPRHIRNIIAKIRAEHA